MSIGIVDGGYGEEVPEKKQSEEKKKKKKKTKVA